MRGNVPLRKQIVVSSAIGANFRAASPVCPEIIGNRRVRDI